MQKSAGSMVIFGAEHFFSAKAISTLDVSRQMILDYQAEKLSREEFFRYINGFFFEKTVDDFKICPFFENYMKSDLLCKGFLVHKISNSKKYLDLHKIQRARPVTVFELHQFEEFELDSDTNSVFNVGLSEQTLMVSTLMEVAAYRSEIALPDEVWNILQKLIRSRNELHFMPEIGFSIGTAYLDELSILKDFAKEKIAPYRGSKYS
jgi:hypothetical protein